MFLEMDDKLMSRGGKNVHALLAIENGCPTWK